MKLLADAIGKGFFLLDLHAENPRDIFRKALDHLVHLDLLPAEDRGEVERVLLEREAEVSTAIGHSLAVPHVYLDCFSQSAIVFVRLARPLNLGAPDGVPTRFVFLLVGPRGRAGEHLDSLANIARLMSDDEFRYDVGKARTSDDLLEAIEGFRSRTVPSAAIVPSELPPSLQYTGRLFGGVWGDLRRRLPHYLSDFRDGLHPKSLSSTLFLFFACLAPAVTFGGVMAIETQGHIGAVEMIAASAFCGVVFALFCGQPLVILGGTGPLLVFTALLFRLCNDFSVPFLPTYAWVGLWTALLTVLLAATDASCLMRYFTRFTDEIFAALISVIFIYEAVKALANTFHDLDESRHHDTALLSLLLALGTFYVANSLSRFRRSRYLLPQMREFLADFGPTIAMAAMTLVAFWLHEVHLDVLPTPERFGTTIGRPWRVSPLEAPRWVWLASTVPALFATMLIVLDQNITARLVNSPDHRLQKGESYHLDLVVVGGLVGVCSVFGLPWLVAATVRSLNHVRSLATVEEVVLPSGDRRDRIIHVRENRVSPLAIHLLIGVSLLLLPLLRVVPMAVLYGLFLFMGIVSMKGNQFFERLNLWPMDSALYPATHYIRKVPAWTIHKFTVLQLTCLAVLWMVKASRIGILFPLFIVLLVPVRFLAGRFFAPEHLEALDAEEEPEEEEMTWV